MNVTYFRVLLFHGPRNTETVVNNEPYQKSFKTLNCYNSWAEENSSTEGKLTNKCQNGQLVSIPRGCGSKKWRKGTLFVWKGHRTSQIYTTGVILVTIRVSLCLAEKNTLLRALYATQFLDLQQHVIICFLGHKFRKKFYPQPMC